MSTTIDEKVVEMRFDNKQFESSVQTSMSTLDKLKQKLNLSGASKGLEDLNSAAKNVNMNGLGSAVETVHAKFSALQVMGVTALARITNSAITTGKRLVSALTIDPVKAGFQEYETQINAVQTILANTKKEGTNVKIVNEALDELNRYADKTIYNFTEMTRNIGTFTAAGVKLDTSVSAIQGIANLAAISGSTSQQASTAMYQLSQAISSGTVKLMDWNSVVNAGMGGQVFQDALIRTSENLQTGAKAAIAAKGSFRESLITGWLTTEVLTETLDQFATAADTQAEYEAAVKKFVSKGYSKEEAKQMADMARTAGEAATKVKTFSQLIDTLKEALGSGWTTTWRLIIGDFEEAKSIWSSVSDVLSKFINRISDARNTLIESALGKSFSSLVKKVNDVTQPVKEASKAVGKVTDSISDLGKVVDDVILGKFGNGKDRFDALTEAGHNYYKIQNKVNEKLGDSFRYTDKQIAEQDKLLGKQEKATKNKTKEKEETVKLTKEEKNRIKTLAKMSEEQLKAEQITVEQRDALKELGDTAKKLGMPLDEFIDKMDEIDGRWLLLNSIKNIGKSIVKVFSSIGQAAGEIFDGIKPDQIFNLIAAFHKFSSKLIISDDNAKKLKRTFKGLFALIDIITTITGGGLKIAFKLLSAILGAFNLNILDVTAAVGDLIVKFRNWLESNNIITKSVKKIASGIKIVVSFIKKWVTAFLEIPAVNKVITKFKDGAVTGFNAVKNAIINFINGVKDGSITLKSIGSKFVEFGKNIIQGLKDGITNNPVTEFITELGQKIINAFKNVLGIHSPSTVMFEIGKNLIQGLLNGIREMIGVVLSFTEGVASDVVDTFTSIFTRIPWDDILSVGFSIGSLNLLKGVADLFKGIGNAFDGFGNMMSGVEEVLSGVGDILKKSAKSIKKILNNVAKVVKSFSKVLNSISFSIKAKAIKDLAISLGIMVLAIIALTFVDTKKLWKAVGVIAVLAAILGALVVLTDKLSSSSVELDKNGIKGKNFTSDLLGIAAAVLLMGATIKLIGGMDKDQYIQGITGLIGIVSALILFVAVYGKFVRGHAAKNADAAGKMLTKLAASLLIMVLVAKLIATMSWGDMGKAAVGLAGLTYIIMALLASTNMVNEKDMKSASSLLMAAAGTMAILAIVAKVIATMSWEDMGKAAAGIAGLTFVVMALIASTNMASDKDMKSASALLMSAAGAIGILALVGKVIATMSWGDMGKAAVGITGLTFVIMALIASTNMVSEKDMKSAAIMLLSAAGAIGILALVGKLIVTMSWEDMGKAAVGILALSAIIVGLIAATKLVGQNDIKDLGKTLLMISGAIAILALVAFALGHVDTEVLAKGIIAVGIMSLMMALLIAATKNAKQCIGNIIALTAAMVAVGTMLLLLSKLPTDNVTASAKSLSMVLLSMSAAMVLISKFGKLSIGAIASLAIMTGVVAILGEIIKQLSKIDANKVLPIAESLSILLLSISAACAVMSVIPTAGAIQGALGLSAFIGIMAALLAALGGLSKIPGVNELVSSGGELLSSIGYAIGNFIGSIIGGIGAGISSGLPEIGTNLSQFMLNAMPFLLGIKMIDASMLEGIATLAAAIIALTAADFIAGIAAFSPYAPSLSDLGSQLSAFLLNAIPFIMLARTIDPGALEGAKSLAELILILTAAELIDGVTSWLTGGSSLIDFAGQLVPFGEAIVSFSSTVAGNINGEAVEAAANAGKIMAEMAKTLPNSGGVAGFFAGENDMDEFGRQLRSFGRSIVAFSSTVAGNVDVEAVTAAANAGKIMAAMADTIPNSGGVVGFFVGENDMDVFGRQLKSFGRSIVAFSNTVSVGIDAEAVTAAANAGKIMAAMADTIPNSGGVVGFFIGENDMDEFGRQLKSFGRSIVAFSSSVSGGIDVSAATDAANAGKIMAAMADTIPNSGGVVSFFTGENDMSEFGKQIKSFGKSIVAFSNTVSGKINEDAVTSAANAGKLMSEVADSIPEDGWFDGKVSIDDFGKMIKKFAKSLVDYSDKVAETDMDEVMASIPGAKALVELAKSINGINKDNIEKFEKVKKIGSSIESYYKKVKDVKTSVVTKTADSATKLGKLMKSLSDVDSSAVDSFKISSIGSKLKSYYDKVSNVNSDKVNTSIDLIKKLVLVISSMHGLNGTGVSVFNASINALSTANMSGFADNFASAATKLKSAGTNMVDSIVSGMNSKQAAMKASSSKLVSAILTTVNSKKPSFKSAGAGLAIKLNSGLSSVKGKIRATIASALSTASSNIRSYYSNFYNAGAFLGTGLVIGIQSMMTAVYNAGYALGRMAAQGEKDGQKSNSPSKLTIQNGKWLGEGLVIGINKMSKAVYNAGYGMGETATNTISDAISRISDFVNRDIETQPTIRPVLDLSDVKSGIGNISNLFNEPVTVGASADIGYTSYMMNRRLQNSKNSDVVSAIDKLNKKLDNAGNTYNSINGITYDDGSNISDAIETIVRAARIERRR